MCTGKIWGGAEAGGEGLDRWAEIRSGELNGWDRGKGGGGLDIKKSMFKQHIFIHGLEVVIKVDSLLPEIKNPTPHSKSVS